MKIATKIPMYPGSADAGRRSRTDRGLRRVLTPAPREKGMTTIGFLVLAVFVGLFAFAAIRLTPVYLNYMKVSGVVNGVFEEFDGQNASRAEIQRSISRRFEVESVSEINYREVEVTPDSGGFLVEATYSHSTPFIGNIHFLVKFNKSVLIRR